MVILTSSDLHHSVTENEMKTGYTMPRHTSIKNTPQKSQNHTRRLSKLLNSAERESGTYMKWLDLQT